MYVELEYTTAYNVDGANVTSNNAYTVSTSMRFNLTRVVSNNVGASLSGYEVTLPAGTWQVDGEFSVGYGGSANVMVLAPVIIDLTAGVIKQSGLYRQIAPVNGSINQTLSINRTFTLDVESAVSIMLGGTDGKNMKQGEAHGQVGLGDNVFNTVKFTKIG